MTFGYPDSPRSTLRGLVRPVAQDARSRQGLRRWVGGEVSRGLRPRGAALALLVTMGSRRADRQHPAKSRRSHLGHIADIECDHWHRPTGYFGFGLRLKLTLLQEQRSVSGLPRGLICSQESQLLQRKHSSSSLNATTTG